MAGVKAKREQAAIDLLLTYGIAFVIVAAVVSILYILLLQVPSSIPSNCVFEIGISCSIISIGSNASGTSIILIASNQETYPIFSPTAEVELGGAQYSFACIPSLVIQGGTIACNTTVSKTFSEGTLESGTINVAATPCLGANSTQCTLQKQNFTGTFSTHIQPFEKISYGINVSAENSTVSTDTDDKIFAHVTIEVNRVLYPFVGVTVNFILNSTGASFNKTNSITSEGGIALTGLTSSSTGNYIVKAKFGNIKSANVTITFKK